MSEKVKMLSENLIFEGLKTNGVNCDIKVFEEIDSTNLEAKRMANAIGNEEVLLLAESQTHGKGRMGRSFYSPQNTGLYMSYMYTPKTLFSDSVTVTAATSVAVVRAIEALTDLKPQIKWVNDIYVDGKKVCGILTEAVTGKTVKIIVGIGVNITTEDFPDDINKIAASLKKPLDRNALAVRIITELKKLIDELPQRTFLSDYRKKSCVLGQEVRFFKSGNEFHGTAIDIDSDGGLVVQTQNGAVTLNTGEISLRFNRS